jgi:multiple sugar transport system permease protein
MVLEVFRLPKAKVDFLKNISIYSILLLMSVFALFPLVWAFLTAIRPLNEVFAYPPQLIPNKFEFTNFASSITEWNFLQYTINSAMVLIGHVAGTIIFSGLSGYAFARLEFPGRDKLFLVFLGAMMIPPEIRILPQFLVVKQLGWVNTFSALIIPGIFTSFTMFIFRQFFLTIPKDLENAACIDGCGRFRTFFQLILPISKPAILSVVIYRSVSSWNEFLWPLIVTSSEKLRVVSVALAFYRDQYGLLWNKMMAVSLLAALPTLFIFILFHRFFIEGDTMSGFKG